MCFNYVALIECFLFCFCFCFFLLSISGEFLFKSKASTYFWMSLYKYVCTFNGKFSNCENTRWHLLRKNATEYAMLLQIYDFWRVSLKIVGMFWKIIMFGSHFCVNEKSVGDCNFSPEKIGNWLCARLNIQFSLTFSSILSLFCCSCSCSCYTYNTILFLVTKLSHLCFFPSLYSGVHDIWKQLETEKFIPLSHCVCVWVCDIYLCLHTTLNGNFWHTHTQISTELKFPSCDKIELNQFHVVFMVTRSVCYIAYVFFA